jgi:gas vesicle protein
MSSHHEYEGQPYVVVERRESGVGPFLLGLALGAGAALLLAPRSGADTRELIRSRARDAGDAARERVDALTSTVSERVQDARDAVTDRVDAVRSSVRRHRDDLIDAFDAGRSAARQARVDLERRIDERKTGEPGSDPLTPPLRNTQA